MPDSDTSTELANQELDAAVGGAKTSSKALKFGAGKQPETIETTSGGTTAARNPTKYDLGGDFSP